MNNLSWPTCVLLGILLGLGLVAADRTAGERSGAGSSDAESSDADEGSSSDGGGGGGGPGGNGSGGAGEGAPDTGTDPNGAYSLTLTFDDGPHPIYTPQVLDLLERYDATAVFCVVGERAQAHPDLIRRIVDDGHALCHHTYTHDEQLGRRDRDTIEHEVAETDAAIESAAGPDVEVRYFRQPGTFVEPAVAGVISDMELTPLNWTVDPRDWSRPGSASIVQGVLNEVQPGAIVLLHDGGGDRSQTVAALERILDALARAQYGYTLPGGVS